MSEEQVGAFAERVLGRLVDRAKSGIDIAFIMVIMDMVMEMLQNCPEPTRERRLNVYRRGISRGRRWWIWRAESQIRSAAECSEEVAAAVVEEFGQLSADDVAGLV